MLKLISINIETNKHYDKVVPFLKRENPDVICLQEAPESFVPILQGLGYKTHFTPMFMLDDLAGENLSTLGIMIASKFPFEAKDEYYHRPTKEIILQDRSDRNSTVSGAYILANVATPEGVYNIATTHPLKTESGPEDEFQINLIKSMLTMLENEEPHLICGDFNIPRGYNSNYDEMTKMYTDRIPESYKSSLDRDIHVFGYNDKLNVPIFDIYMVDYIFTQPPYLAENVRLEFGVSDHAGVIAEIHKTD